MRVALPQMPPSVQQTLGPEATGDLSQWFEVVLVEYAVRRDEYREVLSRLDILEHDVADVKASIAEQRDNAPRIRSKQWPASLPDTSRMP